MSTWIISKASACFLSLETLNKSSMRHSHSGSFKANNHIFVPHSAPILPVLLCFQLNWAKMPSFVTIPSKCLTQVVFRNREQLIRSVSNLTAIWCYSSFIDLLQIDICFFQAKFKTYPAWLWTSKQILKVKRIRYSNEKSLLHKSLTRGTSIRSICFTDGKTLQPVLAGWFTFALKVVQLPINVRKRKYILWRT